MMFIYVPEHSRTSYEILFNKKEIPYITNIVVHRITLDNARVIGVIGGVEFEYGVYLHSRTF